VTDLRQIMLEGSGRRNYASGTHLDRFAHRFRFVVLGIEGATAASDECYRLVACLSSAVNVFSEFDDNDHDGLVELRVELGALFAHDDNAVPGFRETCRSTTN
jgi:hypothetical protein